MIRIILLLFSAVLAASLISAIQSNEFSKHTYFRSTFPHTDIHSLTELQADFAATLTAYQSILSDSLASFTELSPPTLSIHYKAAEQAKQPSTLSPTSNNFPLNSQSSDLIRSFLSETSGFSINFAICFSHESQLFVSKAYVLTYGLLIKTDLSISQQNFVFSFELYWMFGMVLLLSSLNLILTYSSFIQIYKNYLEVKSSIKKRLVDGVSEEYSESSESCYYNPLLDKDNASSSETDSSAIYVIMQKKGINLKQTNLWSIINFVSSISGILGGIVGMFHENNFTVSFLVGLTCMASSFALGEFIEANPQFNIIFETLRRSLPWVIRFLIGVMPVFLGCILFANTTFYNSVFFGSFQVSAITLFSLIQGDSVNDVMSDLAETNGFLGVFFVYCFISFFILLSYN